jgi:ATP-dependent DNA helicase RecG
VRDCWLTRRELADVLERHSDGIRSRFLTQLVEHGLLRLRFPDKPRSSRQRYRLPDKGWKLAADAGEQA